MPRRAFLFSGHRVDAPGRTPPRFPLSAVDAAARRIAQALDALGAAAGDAAFTQGAAGGDLLFTRAAVERGLKVEWLLPFAEPEFIRRSVEASAGAARWRRDWFALRPRLAAPPRVFGDEVRPGTTCADGSGGPGSSDPWERANHWLLRTARAAAAPLDVVCLWDGGAGDGPGGTCHVVDEARRAGDRLTWIDTRELTR